MKIFHVITGLNDGGAEAVLFRLCVNDSSNHHVVISLSNHGKYGPLLRELGVEVHALYMRANRPSLVSLFKLTRLMRSQKPDLVQTWMYHSDFFGGLAALLAGVKAIVWGVHHSTLDPYKSKQTTIWIARLLAKLSWWLPSRIILCAQRAIEAHAAMGYDTRKFRFIPNGYDLCYFKRLPMERANFRGCLDLSVDVRLIGTVGRYDRYKDHFNLLQALNLLKRRSFKFKYLLVGTDLDADNFELIALLEKMDLMDTVILLGRRGDIPTIMSAIDLHVLSSSAEAFPNVVAEAMACGTPCVVTDVGDAAYIVGETGWVVPPKNPEALANAVEGAIGMSNTPLWEERCISARDRIAKNFSIDQMVRSYCEVWEEVKASSLA
jgi:glycosyltransferase involved in cell wall biosynthesis